jgi:predicted phosphodiesterase
MRIGFITDQHANPFATAAVIRELRQWGCDLIGSGGDAVEKGPYSNETVLMLKAEGVVCVRGNHDENSLDVAGGAEPKCGNFTEHRLWTASQLSAEAIEYMRTWPYTFQIQEEDKTVTFIHCATRGNPDIDPAIRSLHGLGHPELEVRNRKVTKAFRHVPGDLVLYGHHHQRGFFDDGNRRYVNPGPTGTGLLAIAHYAIVDIQPNARIRVRLRWVEYDASPIHKAFETMDIPLKEQLQGREMRLGLEVPNSLAS